MRKTVAILVIAVFTVLPAAFAAAEPDVIYFNGKITTMNAAGSTAEAVAVRDGKFVGIGGVDMSLAELNSLVAGIKVLDTGYAMAVSSSTAPLACR